MGRIAVERGAVAGPQSEPPERGVADGLRMMSGIASSSRGNARAWVQLYVRAAGELGSRGLAACFPIGREQLCAEDPDNALRLEAVPDFILALASDGKSVVLTWTVDGTSERYPLSPDDERAGQEEMETGSGGGKE